MNLLFLHILLTLAWLALTGRFTATNFAIGFALAFPVVWLSQRGEAGHFYLVRIRRLAGFAAFFLWELLKANLRVTHEVLTPRLNVKPGVVAVPIELETDMEILVLTTLIALTPGTLSLDVSSDRHTLYIHAMYIDDVEQFRKAIKQGYERRVREVLR